ncbi:MAG TPA: hypothetical protein VJR48_14300 [Ktedonobacterales bacterium]|nr:hypothetical protein [Ktedonobacterales bacterium]
MSHAATGQSTASSPASARHPPPRRVSDIALADAVAEAVRGTPEVVDLSPGLSMLAATYGPGRSVAGIVVRHPTLDTLALEIHVILSEARCTQASTGIAVESEEQNSQMRGPVTEIANQIRSAARVAAQQTTTLAVEQVDVFIDDLR